MSRRWASLERRLRSGLAGAGSPSRRVLRALLDRPYQAAQNRRARGVRAYQPRSQLHAPVTPVERPAVTCIDAHNHLGRWLTGGARWMAPDVAQLIDVMDECGVEAVVNLDGRVGDELAANLDRYDHAHPGRFVTFCHPDWSELSAPGFGERLAARLAESAGMGARGVKVWKDLGLSLRDDRGRLLMPDDDRLDPLWHAAAEAGLPVLIHTADPPAFFEPVDRFNERLEELLSGASSHTAPGTPRFAQLLEAFERLVAAHPATTFIAPHMGSNVEDLGWVHRMLDTYPNLYVDTGAVLATLGRQPRATRRLLVDHPDRILFGSDRCPPDTPTYRTWFRFLETDDEAFAHSPFDPWRNGRWSIYGIDLPARVLEAVYAGNARRLIPGLRPAPPSGRGGDGTAVGYHPLQPTSAPGGTGRPA